MLFNSGTAVLSGAAADILVSLTAELKTMDNPLYVAGYTDDIPINTARYPTNWELSAARSASVVRLFAQQGINPGRMGAIGYAEFRPVAENSSKLNRQKNRRVVIRVMSGDDMYAGSSPFVDKPVSATAPIPEAKINVLQPAEPMRSIFGAQ